MRFGRYLVAGALISIIGLCFAVGYYLLIAGPRERARSEARLRLQQATRECYDKKQKVVDLYSKGQTAYSNILNAGYKSTKVDADMAEMEKTYNEWNRPEWLGICTTNTLRGWGYPVNEEAE